jgi:hypothetical protein
MVQALKVPRFAGAVLLELLRSKSIDVPVELFDNVQLELTDAMIGALKPAGASGGADWLASPAGGASGPAPIGSTRVVETLVGALGRSAGVSGIFVEDGRLKEQIERVGALFDKASAGEHQKAKDAYDKMTDGRSAELAYYQALGGLKAS